MERNELISIVVPVYNVENFLKKCIDSILSQTYKNWELVLVDDGSTDDSGLICDEYKKIDKRIYVIHKLNGGLSDARNCGIKNSHGKYITFVDSDDYVDDDFIEYLYGLLKKYNTDIAISSYTIVNKNGKLLDIGKNYEERKSDKVNCLKDMLLEKGYTISSCSKLYKKDFFSDIAFPIGKLNEDNGTTYKLIEKSHYIAIGNVGKYYYVERTGSIMNSGFNLKKLDMIELTDEMCDEIEKKHPELANYCTRRRMYSRFNILRQVMFSKDNKEVELDMIQYLKKNKNLILNNPVSTRRDKIAIISLLLGINFFKLSWIIYKRIKER